MRTSTEADLTVRFRPLPTLKELDQWHTSSHTSGAPEIGVSPRSIDVGQRRSLPSCPSG